MSSAVAHVPAPPPKRVTAKIGTAAGVNDRHSNEKAWEATAKGQGKLAASLLSEAAMMRARNHQSQQQSRRELKEQGRIVFDNLTKKVKLLKSVRHKLVTAETKLTRANDALAAARMQAQDLATRLERPLEKCTARSQLRLKRPAKERVADEVAHSVQVQANSIATFIQELQTRTQGSLQLEDENERHLLNLRNDVAAKNVAIKVEEDCLALNGRLDGTGTATSLGATGATVGATPALSVGGDSAGAPVNEADVIHHAGRNGTAAGTMQWQQRTAGLLERAQQLLDQTVEHTTRLVAYMANVRKTHSKINQSTTAALEQRTATMQKQEAQLEENLNRLQDEIDTLMAQREAIGLDIQQRQQPLQVAKTRLDARRSRPGGENVRDDVEQELEKEFLLLASSIEQLIEKQRQVDREAARIRNAHARLRQAAMHKQCAIALDKQCAELDALSRYNLSTRGGGSSVGSLGSAASSARSVASSRSSRRGGNTPRREQSTPNGSFLPPVPAPPSPRGGGGSGFGIGVNGSTPRGL